MLKSPWDNPLELFWWRLSHHSKCLSAASLTVSKHCSVKALDHTFYQPKPCSFINSFLEFFHFKDCIVCELPLFVGLLGLVEKDTFWVLIYVHDYFTVPLGLISVEGTNTHHYFYTFRGHSSGQQIVVFYYYYYKKKNFFFL